jgi:lipoprotein-releasing system permease protein
VSVTPQIQGQVMITTQGNATGALVRGMRERRRRGARDPRQQRSSPAASTTTACDDGVLIGARIARQLGVGVGDSRSPWSRPPGPPR